MPYWKRIPQQVPPSSWMLMKKWTQEVISTLVKMKVHFQMKLRQVQRQAQYRSAPICLLSYRGVRKVTLELSLSPCRYL